MLGSGSFILLMLLFTSCSSSIDGTYKLVKGDCYKYVMLGNLGSGKYNVKLTTSSEVKNPLTEDLGDVKGDLYDIKGDYYENIISSTLADKPIHFVLYRQRVILLYNEKRCIYEKIKQ